VKHNRPCIVCKEEHHLFHCPKFKSMKPVERLKLVKDNRLCENCLRSNHVVSNCRKASVCSVPGCGQKHTKFIHVNDREGGEKTGTVSAHRVEIKNANVKDDKVVCVPIVQVVVNENCQVNALLDTASTSSF